MCPVKLKFKTWIPHHYGIIIVKFHFNWLSGARENIYHFVQSNMAAKTCDLSIIP